MLDVAIGYCRRGWNPVPVVFKGKKPIGDAWQLRRIAEADAPQWFNGAGGYNIGVQLGAASNGLTDVDLDCVEVVKIGPYILPTTKAMFGRQSKRFSHALYVTDLAARRDQAAIQLRDPRTKAMLVELRIGGGELGAQTVFPGSTHEDGNPIDWEKDYAGEPATVDGDDLEKKVKLLASCALMARYWPGDGSRHQAALIVGGFLSRAGYLRSMIKVYVEAIAKAAGDSEVKDRRQAAEDAAIAFGAGKHTFGFNGLAEMFGKDIAEKIAEWLEYKSIDEPFPEGDKSPPSEKPEEPATPLIVSSAEFVKGFVPPDYLVEGLLQRRYFYALTGRTGDGKTSVALLLAASVALGALFAGRPTEKGHALIFAGENPDDIRARWIGLGEMMLFDVNNVDVHFIPGTFKISQLIKRIKEEVKKLGGVALVIIDTSAVYYEGEEENSNTQQGQHARRLRGLVDLEGGPCVVVNCHPVKNAADDNLIPRGGGAFIAELDGNLTALKEGNIVTVHWQGKFRGPDFPPICFELRTDKFERLKDKKGRLIPTVTARHLSEMAREEMVAVARSNEDQVLETLNGMEKGGTPSEIAAGLGWRDKDGEPYKMKAHRILAKLETLKLVKSDRGRYVLTSKGRNSLEE